MLFLKGISHSFRFSLSRFPYKPFALHGTTGYHHTVCRAVRWTTDKHAENGRPITVCLYLSQCRHAPFSQARTPHRRFLFLRKLCNKHKQSEDFSRHPYRAGIVQPRSIERIDFLSRRLAENIQRLWHSLFLSQGHNSSVCRSGRPDMERNPENIIPGIPAALRNTIHRQQIDRFPGPFHRQTFFLNRP